MYFDAVPNSLPPVHHFDTPYLLYWRSSGKYARVVLASSKLGLTFTTKLMLWLFCLRGLNGEIFSQWLCKHCSTPASTQACQYSPAEDNSSNKETTHYWPWRQLTAQVTVAIQFLALISFSHFLSQSHRGCISFCTLSCQADFRWEIGRASCRERV